MPTSYEYVRVKKVCLIISVLCFPFLSICRETRTSKSCEGNVWKKRGTQLHVHISQAKMGRKMKSNKKKKKKKKKQRIGCFEVNITCYI